MIGIIGVGNMGTAIAGRLQKNGLEVIAKGRKMISISGVKEASGFDEMARCKAVLLCVKPADLSSVASGMKVAISSTGGHPLLISIAAGRSLQWLEGHLGNERIVRAMPNLAARAGKSFTCFSANSNASSEDLELAQEIFSTFGSCRQVSEGSLNAVTAISGSGLAYFLYFARALAKAGVSAGLEGGLADLLARSTLIGVSAIADEATPSTFDELIASIATPGGTTEAALGVFEQNGMEKTVSSAVHAAKERCEALAQK